MTAPRFETVRTKAGWHARFIAGNGRTVWTTEVYTRRRGALHATELLVDAVGAHFIDDGTLAIRDIDERYVPPPVVLEPPFYFLPARLGGDGFWHDHEYHYRNCFGDECTEGTPPAGTEVLGRMGSAVPS